MAETLGLNRFDPDYYALELGNHVLGGGFYATRLYQDLRENSGLVYFVSSSFGDGEDARRSIAWTMRAIRRMFPKRAPWSERDLKAMQTEPVGADDLRQAKAMLLRQIPLGEASVESIAGGCDFACGDRACRSMNPILPLNDMLR